MVVPGKIIQLIERFQQFSDELHSTDYNETLLRKDYIDPLFKELGWDINNEQGCSQVYREVVHEAKVKSDETTKRPDYAFRIGGIPKFYVETKKPAVNIKHNPNPALQLRSYIWTAKLPLGILTDFEEFAVYDGRYKPNKNDKASTARILYINYKDYRQKWEKIESIFAREYILTGSFDEFVRTTKAKKGTSNVDDEFLKEITRWREMLAKNIALRNKKLSTRELNYVVQKTIDKIIFLRIAEDREIEEEYQLRNIAEDKNIYQRLRKIFFAADDKYNSGLFHFRNESGREGLPDDLSLNISIDDKRLKDIIRNLYYPDCPYAFAVMPAEILGQVYEQFLGKVIRLTKGHQAKVDDKPEVKKAGGVYYTPTYIVNYIVEITVGKLLNGDTDVGAGLALALDEMPAHIEGATARERATARVAPTRKSITPEQVSEIKILDPACGSGSFLIGAYQKLLDWHLEWYSNNNPEKWAKGKTPRIYRIGNDDWMLTTSEKKRILLNNIYGVDIDSQAVEVTKLSLLLKVLENENRETIGRQLLLFKQRALPDLASNIKCGNSLIGSDFYSDKELSLFDTKEQYRINVFDWEKAFPEVFKPSSASMPSSGSTMSSHLLPEGEDRLPSPAGRGCADEVGAGEGFVGKKDSHNGRYNYPPHYVIELARKLRKEKNAPERMLWELLRNRKFLELKFRRQHAIERYIADFYCHKLSLVIEIDGSVHDKENQIKYDKNRDEFLRAKGYRVLRVKAKDVLENTFDVLEKIARYVPSSASMPSSGSTMSSHLLPEGEGRLPSPAGRGSTDGVGAGEGFITGGFDAVIGNPPYGAFFEKSDKAYLLKQYKNCPSSLDSYLLFYECCLGHLLKTSGFLGFITPNTWELIFSAAQFRTFLLTNFSINEIVHFSRKVFKSATVDCEIVIIQNAKHQKHNVLVTVQTKSESLQHEIPQSLWLSPNSDPFNIQLTEKEHDLLAKINSESVHADDIFLIKNGVKPFEKGKGKPPQTREIVETKPYVSEVKKDDSFRPLLRGSLIQRYVNYWNENYWISYGPWLAAPRDPKIFEAPEKIVCRQTGDRIICTLIDSKFICRDNLHIILPKEHNYNLEYILGILNSSFCDFCYRAINPEKGEALAQIKRQHLGNLPIRTIDFTNPDDVAKHDKMVSLVESMLALQKKIADAKIPDERERLERMRDTIDAQLDKLVYELYELTEEEIKVVEGEKQ